ncbi:Nucleotide-sugar transporter [Kalmanozyma brasiliensis GHG001]|uniref:UDP-galactose transporter n=1 Tax=Kalmanozyma brasiliensis (strain GHG001) TaxID=1365824 RepID=V5EZ52_KALBG|nr:Nucleotide-sugar transporter [Kalmanozyma brasiliensis GHG001]EST08099.1 Nucleotide-sugar transporter [Kalmanozyma brasiliensis GHG001]
MSTSDASSHAFKKWASLLVLIFFTSVTSIVSQRSRGAGQARYSIATSVFMSELFKLSLGFAMAVCSKRTQTAPATDGTTLPLFSEKRPSQDSDDASSSSSSSSDGRPVSPVSPRSPPMAPTAPSLQDKVRHVFGEIYCPSAWMMGVPALVYVCQNMLQLAANSYLSSIAYQGLSQLKLITAAVISSYLFRTTLLSSRQWLCLPILLTGVVFLVQKPISHHDVMDAAAMLSSTEPGFDSPFKHRLAGSTALLGSAVALARQHASAQLAVGALLMVLACTCGSYAGVYIETKLKTSMSVPLSVRNAQLATFAMITAGAAVVFEAIAQARWAPFNNFTALAWFTVVLRGLAGYVVSATLRYADTIMKGFATSLAIITTIAMESILTSQLPSSTQFVGSSLVLASTYCYIRVGAARKP